MPGTTANAQAVFTRCSLKIRVQAVDLRPSGTKSGTKCESSGAAGRLRPMPSDNEVSRDLLATLEARRHQADGFAWAVPGLAIAAQAFLLSIALDPSTSPTGRLMAAIAGGMALLGSMHLLVKQNYHFDLYEAVIERERKALGLHSVQL